VRYGWISYYWKLMRLRRIDSLAQAKWIRREFDDALNEADPQKRQRRLLHLTDLPLQLPKSDELRVLQERVLEAYHKAKGLAA
jgi:hypothetical protein